MNMTKNEAYDLLGDLLGVDQTNLFGEAVKKQPKPRPKWKADSLKIVIQRRVCTHCGTTHDYPNPLLLLSESYTDADGNVLKNRQTSNPEAYIDNDTAGQLPFETEYVDVGTVPVCTSCVGDAMNDAVDFGATLRAAFYAQRPQEEVKPSAKDLAKAEQAEKDLMDIIDNLEID